MAKLSQEIDRLNGVLRQKVGQVEALERKVREYEYELNKTEILRRENEAMRREFEDKVRQLAEFEGRIVMMSQEVERLNGELRKKVVDVQSND